MPSLRISGIASGMDIDKMVSDLMKAQRLPLDKLKQNQQKLTWQRDDYRTMNSSLLDFRSTLTSMKLTTAYRARTVASSDETKVTATASSAASQSSYNISEVTQLASAATKVGATAISGGTKVDQSKALFDIKGNFSGAWAWAEGSVESKTITPTADTNQLQLQPQGGAQVTDFASMKVMVDGTSYQVITGATAPNPTTLADNQVFADASGQLLFKNNIKTNSTVKVDYVADKKVESLTAADDTGIIQLAKGSIKNVNSFTIGTASYTVDSTGAIKDASSAQAGTLDLSTGKITMNTGLLPKGSTLNISYTQNYFNFNIATSTSKGNVSENFLVQGTDTLKNVTDRVNSSTLGVSMFYDDFKDKFTITRTETGNFNGAGSLDTAPAPTSADDEIRMAGDFLNLGLKFNGVTEIGGDNAKFTVNGLSTERSSNTFQMSGVTFTLKQKFSGTNVSISVSNDSNKVFDNIKGFIDKYNTLIDGIQKKTSEEFYRDYPALTDDQKQQLSETQQKQWEDKAKSGLLRNDSILNSTLDKMRSNFNDPVKNAQVNSAYSQLSSIGITTSPNYLEGGKLYIDEAKLKAAIQADPTSVENLFRGTGATSSEQGVIQRLYDTTTNAMDQIKQKAGNTFSTNKQFTIGMQLDSLGTQITSFESRMTQVEDRYYRQFTAMEQAMQKSNAQSANLAQALGGGK